MSSTADKLVDDYLERLTRELRGFPRARRRELVDEISGHIAEARAELDTENEAADPRAPRPAGRARGHRRGGRPARRARAGSVGWKEIVALILLPIGGIVLPVVGWFVGARPALGLRCLEHDGQARRNPPRSPAVSFCRWLLDSWPRASGCCGRS